MRTWEIEDKSVLPTDQVREQDFILRIRRLHRVATPQFVVNIALSATDDETGKRGQILPASERVKSWAEAQGAYVAEMSNGDVFIVRSPTAKPEAWVDQVVAIAWPAGLSPDKKVKALYSYNMPDDYGPLRERVNYYLENSRRVMTEEDEASPFQLLQTEAARGPLTAWSTGQIEKLLGTIDVYRYMRRQPVCERNAAGLWTPIFDECFIGFEALRLEHFPKLEMDTTSHLFLALCQALDQHLLAQFADNPDRLGGRQLFLNLSVSSITRGGFARFASVVPHAKRDTIGFELHRGDLFNDFAMTENALGILHREGFKISVDSVSPHVLPYVNLHLLDVDYIKINVSKDRYAQLNDSRVIKAISLIPKEKIIFFRCDSENALMAGLTLGVKKFQGWLIDDYLHVANS
jgi:EAL domain-containing protein (putative c-di-GMP-specific phosphodiesterase class I)